ncbi:MAG: formylglycine-generating enzyme family protein [Gemmataceae bacterium]
MTEADFLQAIQAEPTDRSVWLIFSDWLEESGRLPEARLVRLRHQLIEDEQPSEQRERRQRELSRLLRKRVKVPAATITLSLSAQVALTLSLISPGVFLMGSLSEEPDRYENEGPRHRVRMTRPYYLGIYPVTQAQWQSIMGTTQFRFRGANRPAEGINAYDAEIFCQRLSERFGRRIRLPTEAEWEYACRGGTQTAFYTGDGERAMRLAGWCSRTTPGSARFTRRVGTLLPNPWGLYDMHGNVREWCADDQRDYTTEEQTDPHGPESNMHRIVRGGSWYYTAEDARSASRYQRPMDYRLEYYGFRVAMPIE